MYHEAIKAMMAEDKEAFIEAMQIEIIGGLEEHKTWTLVPPHTTATSSNRKYYQLHRPSSASGNPMGVHENIRHVSVCVVISK
jgi:hypothetical protein